MVTTPLDQLFFATALAGFFAVLILWFFNKGPRLPNRLLAGSIFSISFMLLHVSFFHYGWLPQFPHFFRLSSPFTYLVAPLSFLYVRTALGKETRLRGFDYVHFLPFLLHGFELTPLFLQSAAEKEAYINMLQANPELFVQINEGMLPPYVHQFTRTGLGLVYMFFQWKLILPYYRIRKRGSLIGWLVAFTAGYTIIGLVAIYSNAVHDFPINTQLLITTLISGILILLFFILFLKPDVLYGIGLSSDDAGRNTPANSILNAEQIDSYCRQIEQFMEDHQAFLQPSYTLPEMAEETGIPRHHLSACINQGFSVNFNEFINRYRIDYAQRKLPYEKWERLSIEGVANEVGFSSRSTFSKAFKQYSGMSPSQFRKQLQTPQEQKMNGASGV